MLETGGVNPKEPTITDKMNSLRDCIKEMEAPIVDLEIRLKGFRDPQPVAPEPEWPQGILDQLSLLKSQLVDMRGELERLTSTI